MCMCVKFLLNIKWLNPILSEQLPESCVNCMEWVVRYVEDMYQCVHVSASVLQCVVCDLASNGPCRLGELKKQQLWQYQRRVFIKSSSHWGSQTREGCRLETQLVMEWSKTYENNTEIHSWLRVNLRVWPNDGTALSTGPAERNWVWNSRPRSITPPV